MRRISWQKPIEAVVLSKKRERGSIHGLESEKMLRAIMAGEGDKEPVKKRVEGRKRKPFRD